MDWQDGSHTHSIDYLRNDTRREGQLGERSRSSRTGFLKRRVTSTLTSPCLDIYSISAVNDKNSFLLSTDILPKEKDETIEMKALLDCGARGIFLDQNFARKHNIKATKLEQPIRARNVDGTDNKQGTIHYYTDLYIKIGDRTFLERFYITGLGNQKIILGLPWLRKHNPEINWDKGTVTWRMQERSKNLVKQWRLKREATRKVQQPSMEEEEDLESIKNRSSNLLDTDAILLELLDTEDEVWINTKTNMATSLAAEANSKKPELTPKQLVPEEYHEYLDVFDEDKANRYPDSRPWDHKIKMKPGFEPKSFKTYNLTPEEQTELDKFLKENLDKGYIKPSESPMASPFFFVKKKDGKLRPCQDYRYLNDWTIKNAYPLPLISEIMDKIKGAKYFTKFDVRWGYNNIRIKKEDQWKAAFKTNRGLFEPTIMFFGMCNSPATFQAMMDSIFADMIEGCIVIVYMDDILIFAKTQEELE